MQTYNDTLLQNIKSKVWFYEFTLPDGTKTKTDLPKEVLQIHETRLKKLLEVISRYIHMRVFSPLNLPNILNPLLELK